MSSQYSRKRTEFTDTLIEMVLAQLRDSGTCHIPGFGVFTLRRARSRRIRNPITKEFMTLPETLEVRFHAAKALKTRARQNAEVTHE